MAGDASLLHAARQETRNSFRKNASLLPEDPALAPAIAHAKEVAKILRENVVQGKKVDEDKYSKCFTPLNWSRRNLTWELSVRTWLMQLWVELRIHEHTERGDNDTIKMPNGQTVVIDGKKCSG